MFLERKSSFRPSFLDLGTDPHLFFFETPFDLRKETEWEEHWQSRGSAVICSAACPSILEPCGGMHIGQGRKRRKCFNWVCGFDYQQAPGWVGPWGCRFISQESLAASPSRTEKSQLFLTGNHQELAAIMHQNHFSVKEQACRVSSWVTLSWLRICQNTLIGKKERWGWREGGALSFFE